MAVRVYMVNKQYIELRDEYNAESVWERIKRGEPLQRRQYGETVVFNEKNVTNVQEVRSYY